MNQGALAQAGVDAANYRTMARHLVPGAMLPGIVYFLVAGRASTIVALAAASSVPALHSVLRLLRGRRPSPIGLVFVGLTAASIGLATWLRSPLLILGRGPVLTALMGVAFALSARAGRPLTRTLALHLSTDCPERRRRLAARWSRPQTVAVFRTLSLGWGALLLLSALQQGAMALTTSPGTFMAVVPPFKTAAMVVGVAASVAYVRRRQDADPDLGLLPPRRAAVTAA